MGDPRVRAFREALNNWKRETFFGKLVDEGDKDSIDRRIQEAQSMYKKLMDRIEEMERQLEKQNQVGGDNMAEVKKILETLGPEETWTESLLDQARSALITDLYEYPLTFNATLIDQFKQEPDFPRF